MQQVNSLLYKLIKKKRWGSSKIETSLFVKDKVTLGERWSIWGLLFLAHKLGLGHPAASCTDAYHVAHTLKWAQEYFPEKVNHADIRPSPSYSVDKSCFFLWGGTIESWRGGGHFYKIFLECGLPELALITIVWNVTFTFFSLLSWKNFKIQ